MTFSRSQSVHSESKGPFSSRGSLSFPVLNKLSTFDVCQNLRFGAGDLEFSSVNGVKKGACLAAILAYP